MPHALISMPVAELLKKETAAEHQASESLIMPLLQNIRGRADYAAFLHIFYGFFHPLEQKIAAYVDSTVLPDIAERRNSTLILHDLHALGFPADGLPLSADLPPIDSKADALGALYVLEGSTLGGRIIGRLLLKNETLALIENELHFFNGYGEATGSKWKTFLHVLNQQTDEADRLVRSANETFRLFTAWIRKKSFA